MIAARNILLLAAELIAQQALAAPPKAHFDWVE